MLFICYKGVLNLSYNRVSEANKEVYLFQSNQTYQKVIGKEVKEHPLLEEGRLPDDVVACAGGGSNAMGAFYEFLNDENVKLFVIEAADKWIDTKQHVATMTLGKLGIIHGMMMKVLLDENNDISKVYSISAGLDYQGVGPEHAYLEEIKRVEYYAITDEEAVLAFDYLSKPEGIIPAIESAHAVSYAMKSAKTMNKDQILVINLSGRGDKDVRQIVEYRGLHLEG